MSKRAIKRLLEQEIKQRPDWLVVTSDDGYTEYEDCTIEEIADELSWEVNRYGASWEYCLAYDREMNCYIIYPDGSYEEVEQC